MNNNIKKQLKKMRVSPLSRQEKDAVWKQVCFGMSTTMTQNAAHKSHAVSIFKKSTAITLIFGMTMGTAFAADGAKPGDVLFPLDRAMENAHLSLVPDDKKDELKVKFALERVDEVKEIFSEITPKTKTSLKTEELPPEVIHDDPELEKDSPVSDSDPTLQEGQKETIETVVDSDTPKPGFVDEPKIEVADDGSEKTMDTDESVDEDLSKNPLTKQTDESVENPPTDGESKDPVVGGTETAATTSDESNIPEEDNSVPDEATGEIDELTEILQGDVKMSDADKKRIELALGTALDFLGCVKGELAEQGNDEAASAIDNLLKDLNNEIETLPENITFEVKLSPSKQKVQFEITSEDDKDVVQIVEVPADEESEEDDGVEKMDEVLPAEPKETKLEIKDGALTIKTTEDDGDDSLVTEASMEEVVLDDKENDEENTGGEGAIEDDPEIEKEVEEGDGNTTGETGEGDQTSSTTTDDVLDDNEGDEDSMPETDTAPVDEDDDETTTVKVIIKKLDEDFEFSVTDQDGDLYEIIEEYTDEKGDV